MKKGKQIKSVEQLMKLKSAYNELYKKRTPVAFLQNMQTRLIHKWIQQGKLYE